MNRVDEEVDENPNYDALDYEGCHHHHINDQLKIMKTVFVHGLLQKTLMTLKAAEKIQSKAKK